MKRKDYLLFLTVLLVLALIVSTYSLWNCRKENERLIRGIYTDSFHSILILADMPGSLEYSLTNNASDAFLRLQLIRYAEHAWILEKAFYEMYAHTGNGKYYRLGSAMSNIGDFLGDVANNNPKEMRNRLQGKIKVLKNLEKPLKELTKYQTPGSIPKTLSEKLFNLSEELW